MDGKALKKQRNKRKKLFVKELCLDYAESSTLHGLRYVAARDLNLLEKVFWLATFLASLGLCSYLIHNVYVKWTTSPVIFTMNEKLVSVSNVPFPSVTICPQVKSLATSYDFSRKIKNLMNETDGGNIDDDELKDISMICNYDMGELSSRNFTNSSFVLNIRGVAPKHFSALQSCHWQQKKIECNKLFEEVITAEGICFNMNGLAANEMFRGTVQSDYTYSSRSERSQGWTLENGYTTSEQATYPKRGNKNHAKPDLEVYLMHRTTHSDPLCNGLKSGYHIYLNHPADMPQASPYHYSALNDQVTSLAVNVLAQSTADSLASYAPDMRQCYYPSERYLRYFNHYTMKNCEAECVSNYTYARCSCVGFYMPHDDGSEICAEKMLDCMRLAYDEMAMKELSVELGEAEGCHCLAACNSVEYDAEVLKTRFVTDNYKGKTLRYFWVSLDYNISKVEIYFKKAQFMSTRRSELFGTTDFLANIGGLLGVFLGFSFLSLVEIIYFLTFKLRLVFRRDNEEKNHQGSE